MHGHTEVHVRRWWLVLLMLPILAAGESGTDWISNGKVRVKISVQPLAKRWSWQCDWKDDAGQWQPRIQGSLMGQGDEALAAYFRPRWQLFYPFQETVPSNVRIGEGERGPQIELRLEREELWLELRIVLPGDGAFVVFECPARSHPGLQPHAILKLPEPMLHLTGRGASMAARDRREVHTFLNVDPFQFAWRADHPWLYALLTVEPEHRVRCQWPPGGFGNVYLDFPIVVWAAPLSVPRTDDRLREYGEALWRQAQWHLPGRFAQPRESQP